MVKKQPEFTAFLPVLLSVSALCSHPLLFLIGKVLFSYRKKKKKFLLLFFPTESPGAAARCIFQWDAIPACSALLLAEGLVVLCEGELGAQLCDISPGELVSSVLVETKPKWPEKGPFVHYFHILGWGGLT